MSFEYVDDHRAGKIVVELNGRLNKCGVISPRFDIGVKEIEGWTARLLHLVRSVPSPFVLGLIFRLLGQILEIFRLERFLFVTDRASD